MNINKFIVGIVMIIPMLIMWIALSIFDRLELYKISDPISSCLANWSRFLSSSREE